MYYTSNLVAVSSGCPEKIQNRGWGTVCTPVKKVLGKTIER